MSKRKKNPTQRKRAREERKINKLRRYCRDNGVEPRGDFMDMVNALVVKGKIKIPTSATKFTQVVYWVNCNIKGVDKKYHPGLKPPYHREPITLTSVKGKPAEKPKKKVFSRKKESDKFYSSWEWKKLRFEALKKYGPKCMCCGSEEKIVVDHIKPRSRFPSLELDFNNLQILCNDCNMGKSNDDYTDFRNKEEVVEQERLSKEDIQGISHFNWHESIH